jgi:hypothetical protein
MGPDRHANQSLTREIDDSGQLAAAPISITARAA